MDQPVNYATSGEPCNTTLLFLHGFMGSASDWSGIMEALSDEYRCVAVDLPGHGKSLGLRPEAYTMEGCARVITELLDELGIEKALIVGYSMGGRLALYYALCHPERCTGLFLESASPGLEYEEERKTRRVADEKKAVSLKSGNFEQFLEDWYRQPLFASLARDEELLRHTIESRRRSDPGELAKSLRNMGTGSQPPLWKELDGLRVNTLVVAGELDRKFVGIGSRMERLSPVIKLKEAPGAGHNVHAEASDAYVGLLQDFLQSL